MTPRLAAVTGGTGFLGLHLIPALARAGFRLRLLVRRDPAHPAFAGLAFETLRGDLADAGAVEALVRGADVVIHAAGLIKARGRAEFFRVNRDGTALLAGAARRLAPRARFLLVSSLAAREAGLSAYAASKRAGEEAAREAYAGAAEQLAILRPPAIYGPWDRETLALFRASLWRVAPVFGAGRVAVIHAADAAAAIAALAGEAFRPGRFALADSRPEGYSPRALLEEAARATGGRPLLLPMPGQAVLAAGLACGLAGRLRAEPPILTLGKARELLHPDWSVPLAELLPAAVYSPGYGLAAGFAETAAWYRASGWL